MSLLVETPTASAPPSDGNAADRCFLSDFDLRYGPRVATWVSSGEEHTWLAPGTNAPLTAAKIAAWGRKCGHRFLLWRKCGAGPIGYAELNSMPGRPEQMWIGHCLVDPAWRGKRYGERLVDLLLRRAFRELAASDVLLLVFPENLAAIRCYEKNGMMVTGRERKYFQSARREYLFLRMTINRRRFERLTNSSGLGPTRAASVEASRMLPTEGQGFYRDRQALRRAAGPRITDRA